MSTLRNGDFEADWSEESSHRCLVFPADGQPFEKEVGNIFNPPGWTPWFRHEEGVWSQPEGRDACAHDPDRMHSGEKGYLLFTFSRKHDAGLMQQVSVTPGTRLQFSAWAHAWSNHKDISQPEKFPNPDKSRWSEGAGFGPFFALEGSTSDDQIRNFTFSAGIDPNGGTDPFADSVIWGQGAHIYNTFHEIPAVEAVAQPDTITVFLRSQTLWPFKHNDAYWDDASLVVVEGEDDPILDTNIPHPPEEEPGEPQGEMALSVRGQPRSQYERVYVLLPLNAAKEWAMAVAAAVWERGYTIGQSADDAGVGDLEKRTVIAVNPEQWGTGKDGSGLEGFFVKYYPGVKYRSITAATPEQLKRLLQ